MDTVVLKFGGSSLANNERLMMVANKIIEKAMKHKVVVVVSAQGKTTDNLLKQAKELEEITKSQNINKRELDMLLSTGEQVSASKLAILLNLIGHKSISLNGYQAQIYTNNNYQNASIIKIDTERIKKELKDRIDKKSNNILKMNQKKYEQRNKQDEESIERLNKQLDKIKKYKFKKKDSMIWYNKKELFFDLLIDVKVKSDDKCYCTAVETIKPLWLDDLLWDLLKMETNKEAPLSLRTIGGRYRQYFFFSMEWGNL